MGGRIEKSYKCPKSKLRIPFGFCVIDRQDKAPLFFDGCTGVTGGNSKIFYPHCIEHDLCYHREPISNGKKQKQCDIELKDNLLNACKTAGKSAGCVRWARLMYQAVRTFGSLAFNCANIEEFDYPLKI